jgi:hypothetical protein
MTVIHHISVIQNNLTENEYLIPEKEWSSHRNAHSGHFCGIVLFSRRTMSVLFQAIRRPPIAGSGMNQMWISHGHVPMILWSSQMEIMEYMHNKGDDLTQGRSVVI